MNSKINILYIHGFKSTANSRTAKLMQSYLGDKYNVIAPAIPEDPDKALALVKTEINKNQIKMVVASSAGAFIALKLRNILKIVINPCCNPAIEMPKLASLPFNIIQRYADMTKTLWSGVDAEERAITYGIFSTHDELFSYLDTFTQHYTNVYKMNDGHRISPMKISDLLCNLIKKIFAVDLPKIARQFNYVGVVDPAYLAESYTLNETFVNAFTAQEKLSFANEVWNLLEKSYKYCGGMLGMSNANQLIDESDMWKMVRQNGKIIAVTVYSFKRGGRKITYGGQDGTHAGKTAFYKIMSEDINMKDRGTWAEVSGPVEHTYIKNGGVPIPAEIAKTILSDKQIIAVNGDGYHYTRVIGGVKAEKILIGNLTF